MKNTVLKTAVALLLFVFVSLPSVFGENIRYTDKDVAIFNEVVSFAKENSSLPTSELVVQIALHLLETPYVAATLEQEPEMLTINMGETDCILFVEMCVALAVTIKEGDLSFESYCDNVRNLRYRDGVVDGYVSRIHYTSEWISQNSERGYMTEISSELGEVLYQDFSYMSVHSDSYKQLKDCPDRVREIRRVEEELSGDKPFYFLSQRGIRKNESKIKNGDIVCFVSPVEGLDISHVGLAYWVDDELKFIHASYKEKKVVIDKQTIAGYAKNGIRLVRLK